MAKGHARLFVATACAAFLGVSFAPHRGWADNERVTMKVGYQTGMVTAVSSDSLDIEYKTYRVKTDAAIVDHEGNPQVMSFVRPNAEVQFHVKEGQIDRMVVTNPQ